MKVDILAFGAHPDDIELGCGGSIALAIAQGQTVGMIDLTAGELGTRGSAEIREQEATNEHIDPHPTIGTRVKMRCAEK